MHTLTDVLFSPLRLERCTLPSRIIRSATYEGMADGEGFPLPALGSLYQSLVRESPITIITGFCAISRQGRAMHPRQGAIHADEYIAAWKTIVDMVKQTNPDARLIMQIAHAGRQTRTEATGLQVVGASSRKCTYFRQPVCALDEKGITNIANDFACAAFRAQQAGFDGVQLHAAHGYLIHQFVSPHTNTRKDKWKSPDLFLRSCVEALRSRCGPDFPVFLKISHADDRLLQVQRVIEAVRAVAKEVDAVEVSCGTMEYAMNIFRGACPVDAVLEVNPLFNRTPRFLRWAWKTCVAPSKLRKFVPFTPLYNLQGALAMQSALSVPVIPVGGIHNLKDIAASMQEHGFQAVSLCRPFICEPDLVEKLRQGRWRQSRCSRCNLCAVYCDSNFSLRCRQEDMKP